MFPIVSNACHQGLKMSSKSIWRLLWLAAPWKQRSKDLAEVASHLDGGWATGVSQNGDPQVTMGFKTKMVNHGLGDLGVPLFKEAPEWLVWKGKLFFLTL